jgi:hypothetical protein
MPQVKCPNGHRLQVSTKHIGQTIACPSCQASFVVEDSAEASPFDLSDTSEEKRPALTSGGIKGLLGGFTIPSLINCFVGRPLLFFGLLFVVLGRGCDATSMRSVGRATANYNLARESFKLEWEAKAASAQQKVTKKNRELNDMMIDGKFDEETQKRRAALQKEVNDYTKELRRIQDDERSARSEKDTGEWKPLRESSLKARSNHDMWVYWYEWIFIFGTVVLVLGMLTLAFTGQGAERWVAYIMIAILTFSLYVGGAAWLESQVSSFGGGPRQERIFDPLPDRPFDKF